MKKLSKTALHILQQATQMFAAKGYDGTIMDALAEQADVNKASIYYHFQDKANLYDQCMVRLFKTVVDEVITEVDKTSDIKTKLKVLITVFAYQANANPYMPAILMREFAAGGMSMAVPAREQMQRILFKLKEILEAGREQHIFNQVDPFSTQIMIVGSICLFVTSQPMRKAIKTKHPVDPSLDEAVEGVANIILNGLLTKNEGQKIK